MFNKIINFLKRYTNNILSDNTKIIIQRKLIGADIFLKTEDVLSIIILVMVIVFIISFILVLIFKISFIFSLIIMILVPVVFSLYIYYKNEKRLEKIELDLPDYIRQLSALIKVGYGIESAFNELSKTMHNALNDEIKRALLETTFGKSFNESLIDIAERNNSENLKHTFQIIIFSKESGGNISDILDSISNDLNDTIMLKKERKASVMMSVMFLLISSVIATPFSLGMIRLYSEFIGHMGRMNPLSDVISIASMGYVFIQSVLVSLLIGIVLYSNSKKGIKFILLIVPFSLVIYYFSQFLFKGILGV
ncbi:MAG: type II secretion system F family protein [Methanosphaera stadtmanae]|nr:type II secretion system F family protein [Methanosphaera stadtmanae]